MNKLKTIKNSYIFELKQFRNVQQSFIDDIKDDRMSEVINQVVTTVAGEFAKTISIHTEVRKDDLTTACDDLNINSIKEAFKIQMIGYYNTQIDEINKLIENV